MDELILLKKALVTLYAHMERDLGAARAYDVADELAHWIALQGELREWLYTFEQQLQPQSVAAAQHDLACLHHKPETLTGLIKHALIALTYQLSGSLKPAQSFIVCEQIDSVLRVLDQETLCWINLFHAAKRSAEPPGADTRRWLHFIEYTLNL